MLPHREPSCLPPCLTCRPEADKVVKWRRIGLTTTASQTLQKSQGMITEIPSHGRPSKVETPDKETEGYKSLVVTTDILKHLFSVCHVRVQEVRPCQSLKCWDVWLGRFLGRRLTRGHWRGAVRERRAPLCAPDVRASWEYLGSIDHHSLARNPRGSIEQLCGHRRHLLLWLLGRALMFAREQTRHGVGLDRATTLSPWSKTRD